MKMFSSEHCSTADSCHTSCLKGVVLNPNPTVDKTDNCVCVWVFFFFFFFSEIGSVNRASAIQ